MRPVKLSAATTVDMTREYFDENDILLIPTIISDFLLKYPLIVSYSCILAL